MFAIRALGPGADGSRRAYGYFSPFSTVGGVCSFFSCIVSNYITPYTILMPTRSNCLNLCISNDMCASIRAFALDGILNVQRFVPSLVENPSRLGYQRVWNQVVIADSIRISPCTCSWISPMSNRSRNCCKSSSSVPWSNVSRTWPASRSGWLIKETSAPFVPKDRMPRPNPLPALGCWPRQFPLQFRSGYSAFR